MSSTDKARAAAIGNTEELNRVLKHSVVEVAGQRFVGESSDWQEKVGESQYTKILAKLILDLVKNQHQSATQKTVRIHDENDAALVRAVSIVRQGQS